MANRQTIEIQSVSDLITAKSGREYFTLQDFQQQKFVCFIPKLHDLCKVGSTIDADVEPAKEGDTPRLVNIYDKDGKPVHQVEAKGTGRSFGKSDKELMQQKQLEESKQRSIEAQVALHRAVDLAIAGKVTMEGQNDLKPIMLVAREFYQLLQSLTQISEAQVIYKAIKKDEPIKEQSEGIREEHQETVDIPEFTNVGQFLTWCKVHFPFRLPSQIKELLSDKPDTKELRKVALTLLEEGK